MNVAHKVVAGQKVRLRDVDPGHTHGISRREADERFTALNAQLTALQEMHYQERWQQELEQRGQEHLTASAARRSA